MLYLWFQFQTVLNDKKAKMRDLQDECKFDYM